MYGILTLSRALPITHTAHIASYLALESHFFPLSEFVEYVPKEFIHSSLAQERYGN